MGFIRTSIKGEEHMTEAEKNELAMAYERIEQLHKEIAYLIQKIKDQELK